jgi:hypothetical protein
MWDSWFLLFLPYLNLSRSKRIGFFLRCVIMSIFNRMLLTKYASVVHQFNSVLRQHTYIKDLRRMLFCRLAQIAVVQDVWYHLTRVLSTMYCPFKLLAPSRRSHINSQINEVKPAFPNLVLFHSHESRQTVVTLLLRS